MKEIIIPILNDEYKVIVVFGNKDYILKMLKKHGHTKTDLDFEANRGVVFILGVNIP